MASRTDIINPNTECRHARPELLSPHTYLCGLIRPSHTYPFCQQHRSKPTKQSLSNMPGSSPSHHTRPPPASHAGLESLPTHAPPLPASHLLLFSSTIRAWCV
eukprot:112201-Chlamydomonas_euryale.AAC.1